MGGGKLREWKKGMEGELGLVCIRIKDNSFSFKKKEKRIGPL